MGVPLVYEPAMSTEQIAETLGMSVSNVNKILQTAYRKIRIYSEILGIDLREFLNADVHDESYIVRINHQGD